MADTFATEELTKLYTPSSDSHKGQNGKLLLVGGSHLFHAASIWSLEIASKIVDMVFYSSVPENNQIILDAKKEFRNGIVIRREDLESYVDEADCILIGPGMVRTEKKLQDSSFRIQNLKDIDSIEDEGEQTYALTKYLLQKYPKKRFVIDGGALQMMGARWLGEMPEVILTPHKKEFERLFDLAPSEEHVRKMAEEYSVTILLKGEEDIVCSSNGQCVVVKGGNAGMTKGGTGDVLAGLVAALACKNDLYLSAKAGSYLNKKAGESLYGRVGTVFNASDLVSEIPVVMKNLSDLL